jgi:GGDEF domain-containing protein
LQNTGDITLENWAVSKETSSLSKPVFHFAIKQSEISLDFHLEQFFREDLLSVHYFTDFETLHQICQRYPIDAVLIAGKSAFVEEVEMVRSIKQNILISIVPVLLFHPSPEQHVIVAAYENGAEDFIHGDWSERLAEVRLRRAIDRSRRDLATNPTTRLPGPALIEREIIRQINSGDEFAVCYADLDNFKAFNDYYGYSYGDSVIRMTGRVLKDIVHDLCREGFVGHIAGDDFVVVVPRNLVDPVCGWIIKCFDAFIPFRYDEEDREQGQIITVNRRGALEVFPLLSISIAVIVNERGRFKHIGELSRMLADLKKATKAKPGSNYMVERRQKY